MNFNYVYIYIYVRCCLLGSSCALEFCAWYSLAPLPMGGVSFFKFAEWCLQICFAIWGQPLSLTSPAGGWYGGDASGRLLESMRRIFVYMMLNLIHMSAGGLPTYVTLWCLRPADRICIYLPRRLEPHTPILNTIALQARHQKQRL